MAKENAQPGRMPRGGWIALGLAVGFVALFQFGRFLGERSGTVQAWPIPEALTRDGGGRVADIFPGGWEVVCYTTPYASVLEEVTTGLADAGLPKVFASRVRDRYRLESEFVVALLSRERRPRLLLLDDRHHSNFNFDLRGPRCHKRERAEYEVRTTQTAYGPYTTIGIRSAGVE